MSDKREIPWATDEEMQNERDEWGEARKHLIPIDAKLTHAQMETIIANLWGIAFNSTRTMRLMFDAIQDHGIEMCEGEKHTAHIRLECDALTVERIGLVMEQTGLRERMDAVANAHMTAKNEHEEEYGVRVKLRDSKHEPCQCKGLFDFVYCDGCLRDLGLDEIGED